MPYSTPRELFLRKLKNLTEICGKYFKIEVLVYDRYITAD
jgi:hypothetical protein